MEWLDDDAARAHGVMHQHHTADADNCSYQYQEELKPNSQTQTEPSDIYLTRLAAQVVQTRRVFFFQMLSLHLQELRLLSQKGRCVAGNFRIGGRQSGSYRSGERLGASQWLWRLDLGLVIAFSQNPANQAFRHKALPAESSRYSAMASV